MDELEILKIAQETDPSFAARTYYGDILKFAKAIAAAEREACAKACEEFAQHMKGASNLSWAAGMDCAVSIRRRSNAKVSGAGTASAGLPGSAPGGE